MASLFTIPFNLSLLPLVSGWFLLVLTDWRWIFVLFFLEWDKLEEFSLPLLMS